MELVEDVEGCRFLRVEWATIKGAGRTLEMLLQVYDGDASRRLDLSLKRMVFKHPEDLLAGLLVVLGDSEVQVHRVNGMSNAHDPFLFGGFRSGCPCPYRCHHCAFKFNLLQPAPQVLPPCPPQACPPYSSQTASLRLTLIRYE